MKRFAFLFVLLPVLIITDLSSQEYKLSVRIEEMPDQMVYLAGYFKDEVVVLDSMRSMNGQVYFLQDEQARPGTRWLFFGTPPGTDRTNRQIYLEFIFDREDIGIMASYPQVLASARFDDQGENSLYQEYNLGEEIYRQKLDALVGLIDKYPVQDAYLDQTLDYFRTLQLERDMRLEAYVRENPDTYLARLAASARQALMPGDLDSEGRTTFLREHYFDLATISDPELLASPVYNHKIIEYLSLYRVRSGPAEQEKAFMAAVDVIMANTSPDPELRSFVVEYLLKGFESFQMEEIQAYIADNYVDENCRTDIVDMAMERIDGYRKMAVGQIAPEIVIRDMKNRTVRLSGLKNDYTAVIFWASYCEHCQKLIPKLAEWYTEEKDIDLGVLAISIDTVKNDWTRYLDEHPLPWTNAIEQLGWNGKAASDYNVYATPTIFILDRERRIIAKPYTYREFLREVGKLE